MSWPLAVVAVLTAALAPVVASLGPVAQASAASGTANGPRAFGVPAVLAAAAAEDCAKVTLWNIVIVNEGFDYFFVKTGGGWVSSYSDKGLGPFGTVDLSVSGSTFHAFNPYLGGLLSL